MSGGRRWDAALRGYIPEDGDWPTPKRLSGIRSREIRGREFPAGLAPRVDMLDEWHHGDPVTDDDEGPEDEDEQEEEDEG